MSNLKTYENISKEFIRYLDTLILLFLGSVMMSIALYKDPDTNFTQNSLFMAGAIALLGMSVISFLYVKDIINKALRIILFGVLFTLCVVYAYLDFKSINDKIQHDAMVERIEKEVKQRLKDIRDAQLEYMRVNGVYAQDYATLRKFIKEGKTINVKKEGDVPEKVTDEIWAKLKETFPNDKKYKDRPDKLTEYEAMKLGYIKRDTTYEPVITRLFLNPEAEKRRSAKSIYPVFDVDSIGILPFSGGKEIYMKTGKISKNNIETWVILIKDPRPVGKDTLMIGSLTDVNTNGNWGE
jgi:hypothetical protein